MKWNSNVDTVLSCILDFTGLGRLIGIEIVNLKYQAEKAGTPIDNIKLPLNDLQHINFDPDCDCLYIKIADGQSQRQQKSDVTAQIVSSDLVALSVGDLWQIGV